MTELGESAFRGRQLYSWIYAKAARSFAEMTNISQVLRGHLDGLAALGCLRLLEGARSASTGARKLLFELSDGNVIESVYIPEAGRRTLCVSSQVGCALGCSFCETGRMGFIRNLTTGEIVDQVLYCVRELGQRLTNLVFMGMGEPFLNYENVLAACELFSDGDGIAISPRRIVISTAGVLPGILRFADEGRRFRLAVSLNAALDRQRRELMPIANTYALGELLNAVKYYHGKTGVRPTFEYVLIAGVNDAVDDARRLKKLLSGVPCKINLIPYNPTGNEYARPDDAAIRSFHEALAPLRAPVMIRWSRGDDIDAACGQLAGRRGARGEKMVKT
jgi:23S rRNA (adenine2503-C2)-methyltransferase